MSSVPASSDLLYFTERGSGPPLLLVHGFMVTGEMFEPVIDHFAVRHRVIVPDLRGHGRSRKLGPPYTAARLACDLLRLLDHLGIDSTAVLGYSMGGAIAQQLYLDQPKRCNRLVLACTYAFKMATFPERLQGHLVPLLFRVIGMRRFAKLVFCLTRGSRRLGKERVDWLVGLIGDQDRKSMVSGWKAAVAFDSRRCLADIKCPTLIVAASNDRSVPLHHAKVLHDGITGSQLVIFDGADHGLIWVRTGDLLRVSDDFLGA